MKQVSGQMSMFDLDTPCGKTSPVHTAAIKARTSERCSKSSAKSKTVTPIYLDLRTGSGLTQERSWVTGIPSHGERSTLNFGECPKDVVGSGLWQILEDNVPLKYYLSERACKGVLSRAERRGKPLDEILQTALEQQIERWRATGSPIPTGGSLARVDVCENHAQDGRYKLTEKVPTLSSKMGQGGDNVPYALYTYVGNSSGDDVAGTIDSSYYKGTGSRSGNEREVVCMGFLPLAGEKSGSVAETENGAPTLRATSPTACVIALDRSSYNQGQNAKYAIGVDTEGIAFTVTAKGPGAVCYGTSPDNSSTCGNVGCDEDLSPTLQAKKRAAVIYGETQYVVRRLTPLECCRLQGMPDFWEDGVAGADASRYKMYGNGMALPNALYVMEGFND